MTWLAGLLASREQVEAAEERRDSALVEGCTPVSELVARRRAVVAGVLRSVSYVPKAGAPALTAELYDGTGSVDLVWLGRREIAGVVPGRRVVVEGLVSKDGRRWRLFNPRYELRPRAGE